MTVRVTALPSDGTGHVIWVNGDNTGHTVTAGDPDVDASAIGESYPNGFDSGTISPGGQYDVYFHHAGTYPYFCSIHPWMKGIVNAYPEYLEASKASISNDAITITFNEQISEWAQSPTMWGGSDLQDLAGHGMGHLEFDLPIN